MCDRSRPRTTVSAFLRNVGVPDERVRRRLLQGASLAAALAVVRPAGAASVVRPAAAASPFSSLSTTSTSRATTTEGPASAALHPSPALAPYWDVIVIGSGMAGLTAALAAREAGAERILLVEKGPLAGGHTLYSAGSLSAVSPKRQKPLGIEDSVDMLVRECIETGGSGVSLPHVRYIAEHSEAALDWLEAKGVPFSGVIFQALGTHRRRSYGVTGTASGRRYVIVLLEAVRRAGIDVRFNLRATHLYRTESGTAGRASLEVEGPDGTQILSAGGIVIASGGFTANAAMRAASDPRITPDMTTTANPEGLYWDGAQGDGVLMGREIGAVTSGMENVMLLLYAGGRLVDYAGADIYVNREGERIVDETAGWSTAADAVMAAPGGDVWVITDSRSRKGATLGVKLASGVVHKSETIADMAEGMGIPPSTLERTIASYNRAVEAGFDPATGKRVFAQKIEEPPFYWGRERLFVHMTLGGLLTTPDGQLVDEVRRRIPGFWAAGEVVGGIFGEERPGGMSLTSCVVLGRAAGEAAARRAADLKAGTLDETLLG